MPVTVVVGGQYGSEAKGKVVVIEAGKAVKRNVGPVFCTRCGGPNAGHTVFHNNKKLIMRQIPSGIVVPGTYCIIAAGAMLDVQLLEMELEMLEAAGISRKEVMDRLIVDKMAAVVESSFLDEERSNGFGAAFGSTQTGTGWTAAMKAMRKAKVIRDLKPNELPEGLNVTDTVAMISDAISNDMSVIIEGTQGFGLSLHHSGHYPFCTSKDTSAASFISEVGISPRDVSDVIVVFRTWPIRVGGNSGPIKNEVSWKTVQEEAGWPTDAELIEITSVTRKVRRVGRFDWELAKRAVSVNKPTALAIHGMDYVNYEDKGKRSNNLGVLSTKSIDFLIDVQDELKVPIRYVFTGTGQEDYIDLLAK